jgi:cell division protein FtsQ
VSGPGGSTVSVRDGGAPRPEPGPSRPRSAARYRHRRLVVLIVVAAMAIAGAAAWALLGSGLFAVRSVEVTGTRLVPESEVLAVADVRPGTPLIQVNAGQVAARILAIRQVLGVQVTTSWPNRVVIAVRERTAALAVALPGGGFDLIDADGVVVRQARTRTASMPLFATGTAASALPGDPDVAAAAAVLGELPASVRSTVTSLTAPGPDQVTLQLRSGVTVVWGGADDAAAKAAELAVLMATHARYYDVSSPDSAVTSTSSG